MSAGQFLWCLLSATLSVALLAFGWMPCPACCPTGNTACCPLDTIPETLHATVYWRQYFLGSLICDGNNTTFVLTKSLTDSSVWCGTWGGGTSPAGCCTDGSHKVSLLVGCRGPSATPVRWMYQIICAATSTCTPNESNWLDFDTSSCNPISFVKSTGTVFGGACLCGMGNDVGTTFLTVTV